MAWPRNVLMTLLTRMLRAVTSRLPWRGNPHVRVETAATPTVEVVSMTREVTAAYAQNTESPTEPSLIYAPAQAWTERLATAHELQRMHATESINLDATALLQLLAEGLDVVIR